MKKLNFFLLTLLSLFSTIPFLSLKAMEYSEESMQAWEIIKYARERNQNLALDPKKYITSPSEHVFLRLLILYPNAFGKAMPYTPQQFQNAFIENFDAILENLSEIIITKMNENSFDDWLYKINNTLVRNIINQALSLSCKKLPNFIIKKIIDYEKQPGSFDQWFNKTRNKNLRFIVLKTTFIFLKEYIYTAQSSTNIDCYIEEIKKILNKQPPNSILKTIFILLLYKKTKFYFFTENNLQSQRKNIFIKMFSKSFYKEKLDYSLIFGISPIAPLSQILELAPHLYNGSITSLDLSYNNLKILPETIECLPDLIEIQLQNNSLESLPYNAILSLTELKKLVIDEELYNKLPVDFLNKLGERKVEIAIS